MLVRDDTVRQKTRTKNAMCFKNGMSFGGSGRSSLVLCIHWAGLGPRDLDFILKMHSYAVSKKSSLALCEASGNPH